MNSREQTIDEQSKNTDLIDGLDNSSTLQIDNLMNEFGIFPITSDASSNSPSSSSLSSSSITANETLNTQFYLDNKRERNRLAASKCRERKLHQIATLDKRVDDLKKQNEMEKVNIEKLKTNILRLEQIVYHKKLNKY